MARLRSLYETQLVRIKGHRRDRAAPRCYISHIPEQAVWAAQLAHDLSHAGVYILKDQAQVQESDFVILLGAIAYRDSWDRSIESIKLDADLIRKRIQADEQRPTIVPLLREGNSDIALPLELRGRAVIDFQDETHYIVSLFDLMLTLYAIPVNHEAFKPLRQAMSRQWGEISSQFVEKHPEDEFEVVLGKALELIRNRNPDFRRPNCFISYAWGEHNI